MNDIIQISDLTHTEADVVGMMEPGSTADAPHFPANSEDYFSLTRCLAADSADWWFVCQNGGWSDGAVEALLEEVADFCVDHLLADPENYALDFISDIERNAADACLERVSQIVFQGGFVGSGSIN